MEVSTRSIGCSSGMKRWRDGHDQRWIPTLVLVEKDTLRDSGNGTREVRRRVAIGWISRKRKEEAEKERRRKERERESAR